MKKIIIIFIIIFCFIFLAAILTKNEEKTEFTNDHKKQNENIVDLNQQKIDNIEVIHFHGTHQCYSCITVGKYALKTLQEKFPKEYKNGTIIFKDINAELQENKDIVTRYQARGSSLFVNAIKNGQDDIEQDTAVWRLISDENKFIDYFHNKIKNILK